jgi:hypothetical protein
MPLDITIDGKKIENKFVKKIVVKRLIDNNE